MIFARGIRSRALPGLVVLSLCQGAGRFTAQGAATSPSKEQAADVAAFKEFDVRVQAFVKLQKGIDATLPALKATDVPELIAAHQQALARKIQEARPKARAGDLFTPDAIEAFRHASRPLAGASAARSRAYMQSDGPNPAMRVSVNGIYPDTEPITPLSPALLAAFPALPPDVAYRIVDRTLLLVDLKSRLIVDFAREILPPA